MHEVILFSLTEEQKILESISSNDFVNIWMK